MSRCIVVTGQTATGKTSYAINLAKKYDGELINFDSRQAYKGFDVSTGKDILDGALFTKQVSMNGFDIGYYNINSTKIWLYDVVNYSQKFSSFNFSEMAEIVYTDIINRGKVPIFVGGTYLYIKQILYKTDVIAPPDWDLREKLSDKTVNSLQEILKKNNAELFNSLNHSDQNNPHRLIRKIEISLQKNKKQSAKQRFLIKSNMFIGLKHSSEKLLRERIKERVIKRIESGAINEVEKTDFKVYNMRSPKREMFFLGFNEINSYISGLTDKQTLINNWTREEIKYAGRQLTFMKKDSNISWKSV